MDEGVAQGRSDQWADLVTFGSGGLNAFLRGTTAVVPRRDMRAAHDRSHRGRGGYAKLLPNESWLGE